MALARSQAGSVGDIAAVMKEAVLWTTRGRDVTEDDLQAMLEGREDLSEVQENPFAEMMREDEAAEAAMSNVATADAPAEPAPAESVPADTAATPAGETPAEAEPAETMPAENPAPVEEPAPAEPENSNAAPAEEPAPVEEPAEESGSQPEPPAEPQMSDEEFEEFMKKAQAFYDTQAQDDSGSPEDDDEFPSLEVHSGDD